LGSANRKRGISNILPSPTSPRVVVVGLDFLHRARESITANVATQYSEVFVIPAKAGIQCNTAEKRYKRGLATF